MAVRGEANAMLVFKMGKEEDLGKLVFHQPHLNPQKDYGAYLPGSCVRAHEGQEDYWE